MLGPQHFPPEGGSVGAAVGGTVGGAVGGGAVGPHVAPNVEHGLNPAGQGFSATNPSAQK